MLAFINVLVTSGNKPWEVLALGTLKSREKKVMKETRGLGLSFCLQMGNGPALGRVVLVRMCSAAGNRLARLKQPSLTSQLTR